MQPGPAPSGYFICCGPIYIAHHIGLYRDIFWYKIFVTYPLPVFPGLVLIYIALKGLSKYTLRKVIFLIQLWLYDGEMLPIDIPTPNLTFIFSISIFYVQLLK